jgi:vacuolar-type H+-ATPase subunit H
MSLSINPKSNQNSLQIVKNDINIQEELERLEDIVLQSPRIPLSGKTIVDENDLIEQIDLIVNSLPQAFNRAQDIINREQNIIQSSRDEAEKWIESAKHRAAQILDESGIIRQAEIEAQQLLLQARQEADERVRQAMAEAENIRRNAEKELEQYQEQVISQCQERQAGADNYAADVLEHIESHLFNLSENVQYQLKVIQNGRQEIYNQSDISEKS